MIEKDGFYFLDARPYIKNIVRYYTNDWKLPRKPQTYFIIDNKLLPYIEEPFFYDNLFVINKAYMLISEQKDIQFSKYYNRETTDIENMWWWRTNKPSLYFRFNSISTLAKFKMISENI